jgi:hypothetical protein
MARCLEHDGHRMVDRTPFMNDELDLRRSCCNASRFCIDKHTLAAMATLATGQYRMHIHRPMSMQDLYRTCQAVPASGVCSLSASVARYASATIQQEACVARSNIYTRSTEALQTPITLGTGRQHTTNKAQHCKVRQIHTSVQSSQWYIS